MKAPPGLFLQRQQSTQTDPRTDPIDTDAGRVLVEELLQENLRLTEAKTRAEKHAKEVTQKLQDAEQALESIETNMNCTFCFTNRRDRIFQPCGHIVACSMCVDVTYRDKFLQGNLCPICRKVLTGTGPCWLG